MRDFICLVFFLTLLQNFQSQNPSFSAFTIEPSLTENANAVIRQNSVEVEVADIDKLIIRRKTVVTVLNEHGESYVPAYDFYDENSKIKHQRAYVYDQLGEEIDKFRQKDFRDRSRVGSNDLYTDNRVSYLDYTPRNYPYTIAYESEVEKESTLLLPDWRPVSRYYMSVEKSSYKLLNPEHYPLRFQERHLDSLDITRKNNDFELEYHLKDLPAYKFEVLSPVFAEFLPQVEVSLGKFSLMGVEGEAANWQEFGKWQYENFLSGHDEIPAVTQSKIAELTAEATTIREKARLIYNYVQENTRYISVQLGIGGWEPMPASEVDRLGYGDCKALVNYTRALLKTQNIPSNYAVVSSGEEQEGLDKNFASMQGNHVILNIPQEEKDIWLECTSQTAPFDYLGDFTDNRNVLLVKPEGGEIVKTPEYVAAENSIETSCKITMDAEGSYTAEVERQNHGVPYGNMYPLMRQKEDIQNMYYKEEWGHLHNLQIDEIKFENNRDAQNFTERLKLSGRKLASPAGKRLLLSLNFFHPDIYHLQKDEDRKRPFEILRGQTREDVFNYILPTGFEIEALPESAEVETEFGKFSLQVEHKVTEGVAEIKVIRKYVLNRGRWSAASFEDFRQFMNKINLSCNQKAVLVANQSQLN